MNIYLKVFLVLPFFLGSVSAYAQCKEINAEATVKNVSPSGNDGEVLIEFKDQRSSDFSMNLFGPNKKNKLKTDQTQFKGLSKGKYLVVIAAKDEKKDYCPKSLEITIN